MNNFLTDYENYCANVEREEAYRIMLIADLFGREKVGDYTWVSFNNPHHQSFHVSYYNNTEREPSASIYKLNGHNSRASAWKTVHMDSKGGRINYIDLVDTVGSHKLNQPARYYFDSQGNLDKTVYAIYGKHFTKEEFYKLMGPVTALLDGVSKEDAMKMMDGEISLEDYLESRIKISKLSKDEERLALDERRNMYEKIFLTLRYGQMSPKRHSEAHYNGKEFVVNGEKIHVCTHQQGDNVTAYVFEGENTHDAYARVSMVGHYGVISDITYMDKKEEHRLKYPARFEYYGVKGVPTKVEYALRDKRLTEKQFDEIEKSSELVDIITSPPRQALQMMSAAISNIDRRDSLIISGSGRNI